MSKPGRATPNETTIELDDELENEEHLDWRQFSRVVVFATDWTTETVVSQLSRQTLALDPAFQRRDAWDLGRKSRFIESLILGIPVPQIVLAEDDTGGFIVLDGKQRLLALLHFWGKGEGPRNEFALTGLEVREDLIGVTYKQLTSDLSRAIDLRRLENQPIRTAVIRNWPNDNFLHLVFRRLNTGSLKLSPQELRHALRPGEFSKYIDRAAAQSTALRRLLHLEEPDSRMRDIEIMVRYLGFRVFSEKYNGRMKAFLDTIFDLLNRKWDEWQHRIIAEVALFEKALVAALETFDGNLARKRGSRHLNRAILDPMLYYFSEAPFQSLSSSRQSKLRSAYAALVEDGSFVAAAERDTAGLPNTRLRFAGVAKAFQSVIGIDLSEPAFAGSTALAGSPATVARKVGQPGTTTKKAVQGKAKGKN